MRLIDADELAKVKFHALPYTHITPSDVDAEGYKRGWNDAIDAIDAIMCEAPTIEPERKKGKWIWMGDTGDSRWMCSVCKSKEKVPTIMGEPTVWEFCPNCGAEMKGEGK